MTVLIWLGALVVLLVAVAPYIPRSVPATDLPSHFVLQAAIGAMLLLAAAILFRVHGRVYSVLLLSYFLCLYQMWPFLLKAKPAPAGGTAVRLLQVNVLVKNRGTAALKRLILDENPDIVIAAEVNAEFAAMLRDLQGYPHRHIADDCRKDVVVLSKLPLEALEMRPLASGSVPALFFKLGLGGKTVDFVTAHTANPVLDFALRDAELDALAAWYEKELPPHLIVAGDLNATPYCFALKRMMKRMQLRNARDGRGFLGTFPQQTRLPFLRLPIDHVLVSEAIKVNSFRPGPAVGSDHLPTLTVIRL